MAKTRNQYPVRGIKALLSACAIVAAASTLSYACAQHKADMEPAAGEQGSVAQSFFQYMNDIPLMDGLYESTEETMVFEKPEGRIVKTVALSKTLKKDSIAKFYAIALPQLGWHATAENIYIRQDEQITIRFAEDSEFTLVYFTLEPSKT